MNRIVAHVIESCFIAEMRTPIMQQWRKKMYIFVNLLTILMSGDTKSISGDKVPQKKT